MIKITEIAFTGYPVTDIARAKAFYEGVLGLKPTASFGDADHSWIEYEVAGGTLAISNMSSELWKPSKDGPAIALEVEDFQAALAALAAAGVKPIMDPWDGPTCSLGIFQDPDGNCVVLHKRKAA